MEELLSPLTPDEAKALFHASGITISDWARERGFKRELVYSLLVGRVRGQRGDAHEIAVALGLKLPPRREMRLDSSRANLNQSGEPDMT